MKKALRYFYKKSNFNHTGEQQEAIMYTGGPLFLTAGPGSGKTRVLLWRTLILLAFQEVKPEMVFLTTLTEKAALLLNERLQTLLTSVGNETSRPFDISKMAIGMVHPICNTSIGDRKFSANGERRNSPMVMDELNQCLFIYSRNN